MDIEVSFPQDDQNMGTAWTLKSGSTQSTTYPKLKLCDIPVFILDGPATSLIDEMIFYSNGNEIERLQNYDVVGNLLADLGIPALTRQNKKFEGYGFPGLYQNLQQSQNSQQIPTYSGQNSSFLTENFFTQLFSFDQPKTSISISGQNGVVSNFVKNIDSIGTFDISTWNDPQCITGVNDDTNIVNFQQFKNYAREYILNDGSYGVDHTSTKNSNPLLFLTTTTQDLGSEDYQSSAYQNSGSVLTNKRVLFNFDSSNNHFDYVCPGIQAIKWYNGMPVTENVRGLCEQLNSTGRSLQSKYGVYKKTFHIPILSGVMGHLIPTDQWKLIPGSGCGEMVWEFRLNKYAFFTSGHLDNFDPTNSTAPTKQFTINWSVTKMSLKFDLWKFDESVTRSVENLLGSGDGIILSSQGFAQGTVQQLSNGGQVRNVYQINNGILSLKNVYLLYLLNDYMKYNFCRKNFRISHCLKSIQLKMGNDYLPKQPILGNAGKITSPLLNDDVYPFLMEVYRSQGEMFSTYNVCTISPSTFMVNDRAYNPDNKQDTRYQYAMLHETRLTGKAIYTIDTTADPFDQSVLTGLDTRKLRPIELLIDNDQTVIQTRPSTMYILLHHDTIVQFTKNGIKTTAYG